MKVNIGPYGTGENYRHGRVVDVQIDNYDTWSADHTLALIIHPLLLKVKENKQGAPYVSDDDVPEEIRSTNAAPKEDESDIDEFWFRRWEYAMDQMIWSFEQLTNPDLDVLFYNGMDIDSEAEQEFYIRLQNGLRLFALRYRDLWT